MCCPYSIVIRSDAFKHKPRPHPPKTRRSATTTSAQLCEILLLRNKQLYIWVGVCVRACVRKRRTLGHGP